MAREILAQIDGPVDAFVMAAGGGGCISGTAEVLKTDNRNTEIVAIEPYHVRNLSGGDTSGTHKLEGIGLSFVPSIMRRDLIDDVIPVTDEDAYWGARSMARKEGLIGGVTSGANIWAALRRARELGPGKRVVTVIIDSGLRYLTGDLYRQ